MKVYPSDAESISTLADIIDGQINPAHVVM